MAKCTKFTLICLVVIVYRVHCHLILNGTAAMEGRSGREERALTFIRGANLRIVIGFLFPLFIPKWQNINCLNNWSIGFRVPEKADDWYSKFKGRSNFRSQRKLQGDDTRSIFYNFIEKSFGSFGRNGRECLKRMICQVSEAPIAHNGLIGELFHVFFTPNDSELVDEDYKSARRAGVHGVNCDELYPDCPFGHSPLDKFSVLGMMTSPKMLDAFLG